MKKSIAKQIIVFDFFSDFFKIKSYNGYLKEKDTQKIYTVNYFLRNVLMLNELEVKAFNEWFYSDIVWYTKLERMELFKLFNIPTLVQKKYFKNVYYQKQKFLKNQEFKDIPIGCIHPENNQDLNNAINKLYEALKQIRLLGTNLDKIYELPD